MDEHETEITQYWQHQAAEYDPEDNPHNVWDALVTIAEQEPNRFREAVAAAARAVGARFCTHAQAPDPLPYISSLAERQAAARQHAGLCGKYHAEHIANIDVATIEERWGSAKTKGVRNQVLHSNVWHLKYNDRVA